MSKRVHFIGIGGSGLSAVAQIAQHFGYQVDGCGEAQDTPYLEKVKRAGIKVYLGHDLKHLKNVDLVAVTPAIFYQNDDHPELVEGRKMGIIKKWQDFLGQDLHQGKFVICVAGTHGKSSITALAGLLLEKAHFDPTVEVGATVKSWHNNVRLGNSKYFVSEADEFHDNFASYHPDILILSLVEYDHPEYFGTYQNMLDTYLRLISRIKPGGVLIYNSDSPSCIQLSNQVTNNQLTKLSYSLKDFPNHLHLSQPGIHNKTNAQAIIKLAQSLKLDSAIAFEVLSTFSGLERRLDFLGEVSSIKVYDDYANHPSSFAASLQALHELYPQHKIIAVIEPHTFSQLRVLLPDLPASLKLASQVIISKIFPSREKDPGDFTGADIAAAIPNATYIPEFDNIIKYLPSATCHLPSVILVMGSGNSYLLARQILSQLT